MKTTMAFVAAGTAVLICLVPSVAFLQRSGFTPGVAVAEVPELSRFQRFRQRVAQTLRASVVEMATEETQRAYIGYNDAMKSAPISLVERTFLIHGWRWHSRSVARDANRLQAAAKEEERFNKKGGNEASYKESFERLAQGYDFLYSFSWTQLRRIENDLYFPWLQKHLPKEVWPQLDVFEQERRHIDTVGKRLGEEIARGQTGKAVVNEQAALIQISTLASELEKRMMALTTTQEDCFVPLVSAYVPAADQRRFNFRVISSLGIFSSRLFLVSFAETIKGDKTEEALYRENIPSVAQALVPRWRRQLYEPKTKCLEPRGV